MKTIEISEAAFVKANTYYLLKWALVILVSVTVFYERRSITLQVAEAQRVIEVYEDLLYTAEEARFGLSEIIVGGPNPSDPEDSLVTLRANAVKLRALTVELEKTVEERTDLSAEDRVGTIAALLRLTSLLHYNDVPPELAPLPVEGEGALLLVDYRLGSFGEVSSVGGLTFEDAARYIWLAGIPARSMLAKADDLMRIAKVGDLAEALAPYIDPNSGRQNRALANTIWRNWFEWSRQDDLEDEEKRQFDVLRLTHPRAETDTALAVLEAAQTRRSGDSSTVKLPVIDFPIRLSDAVLILPGLMVGLLLLLWVYLARGRQYAPKEKVIVKDDLLMVGEPPVFLLGIRHNEPFGKLIAIFFVFLPIFVSVALWWFFRPPSDWTSPAMLAYGGLVLVFGLIFCVQISREIHKITKLYVKEVVALGLPPPRGVYQPNTKD